MLNARRYGPPPYGVVLVHGGPGAAGEMAPVARELSQRRGILEPLQTAGSIDGQVSELRAALELNAEPPVVLVGHSWGAWLSFMLAAQHPRLVRKLVLIASGPFEEAWVPLMNGTLERRLTPEEKLLAIEYSRCLEDPACRDRTGIFERFGSLMTRAGAYDPVSPEPSGVEYRPDIFLSIMKEAVPLRKSGRLLEMGKKIVCPVVAIHGDHDHHPDRGVEEPLSRVLKDFRFIRLDKCGHYPWNERLARERFYRVLEREL